MNLNIPLLFSIGYTIILGVVIQQIFQLPILTISIALVNFIALTFFQGASILNQTHEKNA